MSSTLETLVCGHLEIVFIAGVCHISSDVTINKKLKSPKNEFEIYNARFEPVTFKTF